ncbi:hypothetical protein NIES4074_34660 [Cylindrospermum sp. NIES-4074]|nr:hypothetical protein NIES4074_34660 [Cylindrospermum sp. NIES-4074]
MRQITINARVGGYFPCDELETINQYSSVKEIYLLRIVV